MVDEVNKVPEVEQKVLLEIFKKEKQERQPGDYMEFGFSDAEDEEDAIREAAKFMKDWGHKG